MDSSSPVFEMILHTTGKAPAEATANRSDFAVPPDWHNEHHEGQLSVDVAETADEILVVSTMAGADTEKIEVYIHEDLLTIRGARLSPLDSWPEKQYFCNECYWGVFSRTIVLPVHVKGDFARAEYKNGVLCLRIPKREMREKIQVVVVDE